MSKIQSSSNTQKGGIIMSMFLLSTLSTRFVSGFLPSTTSRILSKSRPAATASLIYSRMNQGNNVQKKPEFLFMSTTTEQLGADEVAEIESQIQKKGDEIRQLKADGIDKESLAPHVAELLALKAKIAPPAAEEEKPKKEKKKSNNNQKKKQPPKKKEADMTESELRAARLQKAEAMREAGVEPYEYSYDPTHNAMELQKLYEGKLDGGEEDEDSNVAVAGRIMAKRVFGKLAFFTLQDESGTIQLHLEKNRLGDTFKVRTSLYFDIYMIHLDFFIPHAHIFLTKEHQSMG